MKRLVLSTVANLLLLTHVAWVFLLIGGTVYIFYNQNYIQLHLTIITVTLLFNLFLGYCPLTIIEEKIRRKSNPNFNYGGSFAATYIKKVFSIDLNEEQILFLMTMIKLFSYIVAVLIVIVK